MLKFDNNIENSQEKKIRKGLFLPSNVVNLGYFSVKDVNPANSLAVIDASVSIKENFIEQRNDQQSYLANETGMLFDKQSGSTRFPSADFSITSYGNSYSSETQYVDVDKINGTFFGRESSTDYLYSYYVSRFFTVQENYKTRTVEQTEYQGRKYLDVLKSSDLHEMSKVTDKFTTPDVFVTMSDGQPYNDQSGKPKYRIFFERYKEKFVSQNESLARVIVLLEDAESVDIRLHYPKIEIDKDGLLTGQNTNHSEIINALPIFTERTEEATVVDYGSKYENTYSVQSSETIQNRYSVGGSFDSRGFNIFVNKKAIPDNRQYELFSWRIVGKITRKYEYSKRLNGIDSSSSGQVKVGIIKQQNLIHKNYYGIFQKLNISGNPINLYNYSFVNPISDQTETDQESYWTVDMESITFDQARSFDVLVLSVESNTDITPLLEKLKAFLSNGGCLLVDLEGTSVPASVRSLLPTDIGSTLNTGNHTSVEYNRTDSDSQEPYSSINLLKFNQSWDLTSSIFDTGYEVYGKKSDYLNGQRESDCSH